MNKSEQPQPILTNAELGEVLRELIYALDTEPALEVDYVKQFLSPQKP